ncbi:MAG: type II toxin-antitoxin system VapC family toxin [Planctomycetota bacterium]
MPTVYIETTVVSYLTAAPRRDLIVAAHQQITREWWETRRPLYDVLVSEVVLQEIRAGDPEAARRRLEEVEGIRLLAFNDEINSLARAYQAELQLPPRSANDVLHIAFAVAYEVDFLLTWNCAHIANGTTIQRLAVANQRLGLATPVIVTPEELMAD